MYCTAYNHCTLTQLYSYLEMGDACLHRATIISLIHPPPPPPSRAQKKVIKESKIESIKHQSTKLKQFRVLVEFNRDVCDIQRCKKAQIHGLAKSLSPVKTARSSNIQYFDLRVTDGKKTVRAVSLMFYTGLR